MRHSFLCTQILRHFSLSIATSSCLWAGLENVRLHDAVGSPPLMYANGFSIAPDSSTVAFRANFASPTLQEFFLVPITGGTPVPANLNAPGATNGELDATAATGHFYGQGSIFASLVELNQNGSPKSAIQAAGTTVAAQNVNISPASGIVDVLDAPARNQIAYVYSFSGANSVRGQEVGTPSPNLLSPSGLNVTDQAISPDGNYLITSGTGGSVLREAVYSTLLDEDSGVIDVALTGAPVLGGGITDFKISDDSASVVIRGAISAISVEELYACPIDGSGPLVALVSSPASVTDYAISPDGTKVVYLRKVGIGTPELYVKPITGGTAVKLNGTLPSGANGISNFAITADSQRVVYLADQTTVGVNELFVTMMDGTGNTKLNSALVRSISAFKLSPEGGFAIYRADPDAVGRHELFHVAVTGGTVTRQHPPLGIGRTVRNDFLIPSEQHIAFRGDISGIPGQVQLYVARAANPAITRMDTISIAAGDVDSFEAAPDGNTLVYLADVENDTSVEVHAAWGVPEITPLVNRWGQIGTPVINQTFTISDVETPANNLIVTTSSSNTAVVAETGISVTGIGSSRTISITPVSGATGSTIITVQVSDGTYVATRTFSVIRYSSEYWNWLISHFGLTVITNETLKTSIWGPNADSDGDDRENYVEYALGSSPTTAENFLNPITIAIADVSGTSYARISHRIRTNETMLTYRLNVSTNLQDWSTTETGWVNAGTVSSSTIDANFSQIERQLSRSTTIEPRQFVALEIIWGVDE